LARIDRRLSGIGGGGGRIDWCLKRSDVWIAGSDAWSSGSDRRSVGFDRWIVGHDRRLALLNLSTVFIKVEAPVDG
jgi:hypothetical protein